MSFKLLEVSNFAFKACSLFVILGCFFFCFFKLGIGPCFLRRLVAILILLLIHRQLTYFPFEHLKGFSRRRIRSCYISCDGPDYMFEVYPERFGE